MKLTYLVCRNKRRELGKMSQQMNLFKMQNEINSQMKNSVEINNLSDKEFKVMITQEKDG